MRNVCLAVVASLGLLLAAFAHGPAEAQDYDSLRNQIDQLRQQVRQLSNQVNDLSRGGGRSLDSGDAALDDGVASPDRAALYARLDEINETMRRMNGRLEELEYKVGNLSSGLEIVKRDADLKAGAAGQATAAADAGSAAASGAAAAGASSSAANSASSAADAGGPTNLTPSSNASASGAFDSSLGPRSLGTLPLEPGESPPRPAAGAAANSASSAPPEPVSGGETAVASIAPATPKEQYDAAQKLLKNAQYAEAEAAFRAYIDANPKDANVEKASYWLGETFYARKNFAEASRVYARNVQQWPKGDKAPDNLVKLSLSLISLKRSGEACQFLVVLETDYPNAAQNVKQAAERAKKQAKCS